jgi:phosphonate transport system permease protein
VGSSGRESAVIRRSIAMSNLYWDQVGLVLLVIFGVVILTEALTIWVRGRII